MYSKIQTKLSCEFVFCECSENCYFRATQHHHEFPNSSTNRKLYGRLLDRDENIKLVSHHHHARMKNIQEKEFCERLNIQPRSKTEKAKSIRVA